MTYSLMNCMFFMLMGYLINNVPCQKTKLIYYLHQPHQEQISLYSYHPTIEKYSQHITSFWYPCTDYQIAPIWDCKVALIGGISNISGVRCPYTGIIDMLNLKFAKTNLTLNHNRTHFATELVSKKKLFVCGGMNETENACEVWTEGKLQFEIANYNWDEHIGPRSKLTLHQLGDQLCSFGGTKSKDGKSSTQKVHCFNTSHPINISNHAIQQNYTLSTFRGGHSSIVHKQTNTSWKVFLCGGMGIKSNGQTCEVLTISNVKRKSSKDYCSFCLESYVTIDKYCKLIGTESDVVGIVFGVDYKIPTQETDGTYVADFYATPLRRSPLPVKHRLQEIQLFTVNDHCPFSKKLEDLLFSTMVTKSNTTESPFAHICSNPAQLGTNTLHSDGKSSTSAYVATIITLSVIMAIMAIVIIGMLTRRIPIIGTSAQARCIAPNKKITEDSESQELREIDSSRQDAIHFPQNGITSVTSSGDLLELNSTESHLKSITCSKQRSNPRQHPVAFADNLNNLRQSASKTQQYTIDLESSAKC